MKIRILFIALVAISIVACKNQSSDKDVANQLNSTDKETPAKVENPAEPEHEAIGDLNFVKVSELEKTVKNDPKKVLVDVYTDWCTPCKMMDRMTFVDPDVQAMINDNFHMVKFNAEGNYKIDYNGQSYGNPTYDPNKRGRNGRHEMSSIFRVSAYPTILVLNENLEIVDQIRGFQKPEQFIASLESVK